MATLGEYISAGSSTTKLLLHLNGNSTDSSGNGNSGTDTAITYSLANGKLGQGARFNGSSSYIQITNSASLVLTNNFTISLWFKPNNLTQNNTYIFTKGSPGSSYGMLWEYVNDTVEFFGGSVDFRTGSQIVIGDTNWHNIIYTFDGTTLNGCLDGSNKISVNKSGLSLANLTGNMFIGSASTSANFCACNIDELIIENRAWSASEIKKYYTNSLGRF